jgi:hypothetical protein
MDGFRCALPSSGLVEYSPGGLIENGLGHTAMQAAIQRLVQVGPFPRSNVATTPILRELETLLAEVQTPVTDDEARALVRLFGPDDCFGLAWSLLHLVETSPDWPIDDALDGLSGEWIDRLKERGTKKLP